MIGDVLGAIYDFSYLMLLWLPGILGGLFLGARRVSFVLPFGFLVAVAGLGLGYSGMAFAGLEEHFWLASRLVSFIALLGMTGIAVWKRPSGILTPLTAAAGLATLMVVLRNILRLDTRPGYSDQFLIGLIASEMQAGVSSEVLGEIEYLKRGFAFPLALTAGREGLLLISVVPLIATLLILATFHLVRVLTPSADPIFRIGIFLAVLVLWASTSFFWGMFGYQNAHALVALGVAVLLACVFDTERREQPDWFLGVAGAISSFVIAQSRIEAIGLALVVLLPVLMTSRHRVVSQVRWRLASFLGAPFGFLLWLFVTDSEVLDLIPWFVVLLALTIPPLFLIAFPLIAPSLFRVLGPLLFGALAAIGIWYFALSPGSQARWDQFVLNTFFGDGMWGYFAWVFLAIVAITYSRRLRLGDLLLLWVAAVSLLFTIDVKVVDGLLDGGGIGGTQRGWTDSTNRAFFHLFAPLTATMTVGLLATIRRGRRFGLARRQRVEPSVKASLKT